VAIGTMRFLVSQPVSGTPIPDDEEESRRARLTDKSVVPLDDEARALPATLRAHAVRAILLGQIMGEIQWTAS
jgi:hypothetical protein